MDGELRAQIIVKILAYLERNEDFEVIVKLLEEAKVKKIEKEVLQLKPLLATQHDQIRETLTTILDKLTKPPFC